MCSEDATQNQVFVNESRVWFSDLFDHLSHCGAFLGAASASLGTSSHLLVVREFFACGSTGIAALGTAFTSVSAEITLPSTK